MPKRTRNSDVVKPARSRDPGKVWRRRRYVPVLVEQLDDRTLPSAVAFGLGAVDFRWLGQPNDLIHAVGQYRTELPSVANLAGSTTAPLRHEAIIVDGSIADLNQMVRQLE